MHSTSDTSSQSPSEKSDEGSRELIPHEVPEEYNTVFKQMMDRVSDDENPEFSVLACVAYALYKNEKRDWIKAQTQKLGKRPSPDQVKVYVSSWSDLRIETTFAAAEQIIEQYTRGVFATVEQELSERVYENRFREIADLVRGAESTSRTQHGQIADLISLKTKPSWGISIAQNLTANVIWFFVTILIILAVFVQFDQGNFIDRVKAFMAPQQDKAPGNGAIKKPD